MSFGYQEREEFIRDAKASGKVCPLCKQPLGNYSNDHLHIDHIKPVSRGGTNDRDNLQVVHKTCNLMKSNNESL